MSTDEVEVDGRVPQVGIQAFSSYGNSLDFIDTRFLEMAPLSETATILGVCS